MFIIIIIILLYTVYRESIPILVENSDAHCLILWFFKQKFLVLDIWD